MANMEVSDKKSWFYKVLPAITLMIMAPMIAEVMPGATRMSSIFVFPIEVLIWGSGTVLIRFFVRKYRLGWLNMVLLAIALSIAEECLIQQTSLAPLAIQMNNADYARYAGVNTVYFLWALLYEVIFVVCAPILLCEMLFPTRKDRAWLNGWGVGILMVLFMPACALAWYGWNIAFRVNVQHLPVYNLPPLYAAISASVILLLIMAALGPARRILAAPAKPMRPPHPLVLAILSAAAIAAVFVIEVLAFGIKPDMPPVVPLAGGLWLAGVMLMLIPCWMAAPQWSLWHAIAMSYSAILINFALLFIGFGDNPLDLYGKIFLDIIGALLMLWLASFALGKSRSIS